MMERYQKYKVQFLPSKKLQSKKRMHGLFYLTFFFLLSFLLPSIWLIISFLSKLFHHTLPQVALGIALLYILATITTLNQNCLSVSWYIRPVKGYAPAVIRHMSFQTFTISLITIAFRKLPTNKRLGFMTFLCIKLYWSVFTELLSSIVNTVSHTPSSPHARCFSYKTWIAPYL